jgi:hypothetical protein
MICNPDYMQKLRLITTILKFDQISFGNKYRIDTFRHVLTT